MTTETPLARTRRVRRMYRVLARVHADAHCELDFSTPFQLLVATVLSAQTTDARVNMATPALFARFPDAPTMAAAELPELEEMIRSIGLYRSKARSLQGLSRALVERHAGELPREQRALVALPGVGRKTANVVLGNAFGVPGITVDTHFGRLARRMGWTAQEDPVKVEAEVSAMVARRDWTQLSHVLIFHGRRYCHARRPACGVCPVARDCPGFGLGPTDPEVAVSLVTETLALRGRTETSESPARLGTEGPTQQPVRGGRQHR